MTTSSQPGAGTKTRYAVVNSSSLFGAATEYREGLDWIDDRLAQTQTPPHTRVSRRAANKNHRMQA